MRGRRRALRQISALLGLSVAACVLVFDAPARADPMALWRIVHGACVSSFRSGFGSQPLRTRGPQRRRRPGHGDLKVLGWRRSGARHPNAAHHRHRRSANACAQRAAGVRRRLERQEPRRGSSWPRACRGAPLDWRSTRNGRAARSNCMSMSIAWPFRWMKALAEYASALDVRLARDDGPAAGSNLFRASGGTRPILSASTPPGFSPTGSRAPGRIWAPTALRRWAQPSTGSPASSCWPTSFPWRAAVMPRTFRITIARLPARRHDRTRPLVGPVVFDGAKAMAGRQSVAEISK